MLHFSQVTCLIMDGPSQLYRDPTLFCFVPKDVAQHPKNAKAYSWVEIAINSIEPEDESGQSFSFTGRPRALVNVSGERKRLIGARVAHGCFSTKSRTGWITL